MDVPLVRPAGRRLPRRQAHPSALVAHRRPAPRRISPRRQRPGPRHRHRRQVTDRERRSTHVPAQDPDHAAAHRPGHPTRRRRAHHRHPAHPADPGPRPGRVPDAGPGSADGPAHPGAVIALVGSGTAVVLVVGAVLVSMLLAVAITGASVVICAVVLRSLLASDAKRR